MLYFDEDLKWMVPCNKKPDKNNLAYTKWDLDFLTKGVLNLITA